MDSVSRIKTKIIEFLSQGREAEASQLIKDENKRLRGQLEELRIVQQAMSGKPVADTSDGNGPDLRVDPDEAAAAKAERRRRVFEAANAAAPEVGNSASVYDIVRALKQEGFTLGVQPNRESTSVSSILSHADEFKKTSKGIYVRVK